VSRKNISNGKSSELKHQEYSVEPEVQNVLKNWQYLRLSVLGKSTVLKSLVAPQLVNVFSPLQTNHQAIKELNKAFYHFLWDNYFLWKLFFDLELGRYGGKLCFRVT